MCRSESPVAPVATQTAPGCPHATSSGGSKGGRRPATRARCAPVRLVAMLLVSALAYGALLVFSSPALAVPGNVTGELDVGPPKGQQPRCCDVTTSGLMNGWRRGDLEITVQLEVNGVPRGVPGFNSCENSTSCAVPVGPIAHVFEYEVVDLIVTATGPDAPPGGVIHTEADTCGGCGGVCGFAASSPGPLISASL